MKPTISLLHVSGILPAQFRNDPALKGIAFASHARAKQSKEPSSTIPSKELTIPTLLEQITYQYYQFTHSALPIHSFVRLMHPVPELNLGGIYLIYKRNAEENTYSFSPTHKPTIHRWAIDPIDIYPGLELELKETHVSYDIKPGIHKVRSVSIDEAKCNISITDEKQWTYINDGDLYLPAKESQGA